MICDSIVEPITRRVNENKSLDDIAKEICPKVTYGKEKIIRIIKDFLGEEYLIQHAETLKYDVGKAQLAKKRKQRSHEKIDASLDSVIESNNATLGACCRTTLRAVNTEHRETGQTKGQEQALEEHDTSAACCQERVVPKKIISECKDSEEETMEQLEELDAVPKINVSHELLEAINKLIRLFSFAEVEQALKLAQR